MRLPRIPETLRIGVLSFACWLAACTTSPLSITGQFSTDARLLEQGAPSQFNASDVELQLSQQGPLLYFYAYRAGVLPLDPRSGKYPDLTHDLNEQQRALVSMPPSRWIDVVQAGEQSVDLICGRYESALYELDKNRRAALANLTSIQSATVAIMGLAIAAQKAIGIAGVAFGLAASLFDTTISSVLYQLPPASVVSVMNAQRDLLRAQETVSNPNWTNIQTQTAAANRLNEYIRYCTPVIIEASRKTSRAS